MDPYQNGGLKVRIGPSEGSAATGEPVTVGQGRYPGTILRSDGPMEGAPYRITILYAANGREWRIIGDLVEPADANNPNLDRFFVIVNSLRHNR